MGWNVERTVPASSIVIAHLLWCWGFGAGGLGVGVQNLGFRVWGLGFGVWGSEFGDWGPGLRVCG